MGERDRLGTENRDVQNYISKLASRWNFSMICLYKLEALNELVLDSTPNGYFY